MVSWMSWGVLWTKAETFALSDITNWWRSSCSFETSLSFGEIDRKFIKCLKGNNISWIHKAQKNPLQFCFILWTSFQRRWKRTVSEHKTVLFFLSISLLINFKHILCVSPLSLCISFRVLYWTSYRYFQSYSKFVFQTSANGGCPIID